MLNKDFFMMRLSRGMEERDVKEVTDGIMRRMFNDEVIEHVIKEGLRGSVLNEIAMDYFVDFLSREFYGSPETMIERILYKQWVKEWMPPEYVFVPCFIAEGLEKSVQAFGESNSYSKYLEE